MTNRFGFAPITAPHRAGAGSSSPRVSRWVAVVLAVWLLPTSARAAEPLFLESSPLQTAARSPHGPSSKRERLVRLNVDFLAALATHGGGQPVALNLFRDTVVPVVLDKTEALAPGRTLLTGHVENEPQSQFLLVSDGEVVAGSLLQPGQGVYQIQSASAGLHRVVELSLADVPPCGLTNECSHPTASVVAGVLAQGLQPPPPAPTNVINAVSVGFSPSTDPQRLLVALGAAANHIAIVDVLMVYTAQARDGAGGEAGIRTLIDLSVAEANSAYENSGVNVRLHLVNAALVDYAESGNPALDLDRLRNPTDGFLDEVHPLRDLYQADLVCLFTETSNGAAGLGYLMTTPSSTFQSFGFSVVQRRYATGIRALAHELGHNMGCAHDRENSLGVTGAYSYSYGNRFVANGATFRTIMAYAPGQAVGLFSSPDVFFQGVPTGVAAGLPGEADNVRTINNTAHIVASFREPLPSNDNFAGRLALTGSAFTVFGSNRQATKEPGEPNHADVTGGQSVWWTWTAPATGPVTLTTAGSEFDTVLAVYTGTNVANLTKIAGNDDVPNSGNTNSTSLVEFTALAGTAYQIAVDGFSGSTGDIQLNLTGPQPPPPAPGLEVPIQLSGGHVLVRVTGTPGQSCTIQASADFQQWLDLTNITFTTATFDVIDSDSGTATQRFYRARLSP